MKVICAGLPKTGTKSLCSALRILGYEVYDFEEQFWFTGKQLQKALDLGCTEDEYRDIFKDVDAVTDMPCCMLWEEISQAYPEAKIILCQRKNEDEWCKSFLNQISVIRGNPFLRLLLSISPTGSRIQEYGNACARVGFGFKPSKPWMRAAVNERMCKQRYREHNSYVMQSVPNEKLLLLKLEDGWEPLCKFLGVSIPKQEFPFRNKGGVIVDELIDESPMFRRIKQECIFALSVIALIFACIICVFVM